MLYNTPVSQESTAELDTDALKRGWDAAKSARVPKRQTQVAWAARTDMGRVRENNEDKFDFYAPDDAASLALRGRLWAVADGMGGHSAGQIASEACLKTVIRSYFNPSDAEAQAALVAAIAGRQRADLPRRTKHDRGAWHGNHAGRGGDCGG